MRLLPIILFASFACSPCFAEHLCRASVSYSWQRDKEMTKIMVFAAHLEVSGADEAAARQTLQERAEREKSKAAEQCTREHENQSGCVAAKMTSMTSTLQSLNFTSRKLLEESIATDCKAQQGKCGESALSEPQCVEKVVATKAEGKDAGKDATAKDPKKKK